MDSYGSIDTRKVVFEMEETVTYNAGLQLRKISEYLAVFEHFIMKKKLMYKT